MGLPKKNPRVFKPSFSLPPKLRSIVESSDLKWDEKGSVIENYKSFGVVSNPNLLGVRSRTNHIIESGSLQVPPPPPHDAAVAEFESDDSGSDLEEDGSFSLLYLLFDLFESLFSGIVIFSQAISNPCYFSSNLSKILDTSLN